MLQKSVENRWESMSDLVKLTCGYRPCAHRVYVRAAGGAIARTSLNVSPSCRPDSSLIVSTHSLRFFQSGIVWTLTLNNAAISASVRFLAYLSAAALRTRSASSTAFADSGLGLSGFS